MFNSRLNRTLWVGLILFGFGFPAVVSAGSAEAGSVLVNGQKTFPLGWYALSWYYSTGDAKTLPLRESAQHGWNFVMPYHPFQYATNQEVVNYLDTAASLGVKVMIDTSSNPVYKITSMVNLVKNHPALYGYYVEDEPEIRGISVATVLAEYNAIRNTDPNLDHPILLTFSASIAANSGYLGAGDIIGKELYNSTQISQIAADIAAVKAAGKSFIAIPRMYQNGSSYAKTVPTADEFKYLVFNPISKGAGGIMPFIFEGHTGSGYTIPPAGFRDQSAYPVTALLQQIIPTLLKGSDTLEASLDHWDELLHGGQSLSWMIAGDACDAVLIVVNDGDQWVSGMDFTLTGLHPAITTGMVLGENRMVKLTNNTFADNFLAYGVHIYRFSVILGDANRDDRVDVGDLGILAANYGQSGKGWAQGDFNNDTRVDVGDLGILASHYGQGSGNSSDFNADYARVFGSSAADKAENDMTVSSSACSLLGVPLAAGLMALVTFSFKRSTLRHIEEA